MVSIERAMQLWTFCLPKKPTDGRTFVLFAQTQQSLGVPPLLAPLSWSFSRRRPLFPIIFNDRLYVQDDSLP